MPGGNHPTLVYNPPGAAPRQSVWIRIVIAVFIYPLPSLAVLSLLGIVVSPFVAGMQGPDYGEDWFLPYILGTAAAILWLIILLMVSKLPWNWVRWIPRRSCLEFLMALAGLNVLLLLVGPALYPSPMSLGFRCYVQRQCRLDQLQAWALSELARPGSSDEINDAPDWVKAICPRSDGPPGSGFRGTGPGRHVKIMWFGGDILSHHDTLWWIDVGTPSFRESPEDLMPGSNRPPDDLFQLQPGVYAGHALEAVPKSRVLAGIYGY